MGEPGRRIDRSAGSAGKQRGTNVLSAVRQSEPRGCQVLHEVWRGSGRLPQVGFTGARSLPAEPGGPGATLAAPSPPQPPVPPLAEREMSSIAVGSPPMEASKSVGVRLTAGIMPSGLQRAGYSLIELGVGLFILGLLQWYEGTVGGRLNDLLEDGVFVATRGRCPHHGLGLSRTRLLDRLPHDQLCPSASGRDGAPHRRLRADAVGGRRWCGRTLAVLRSTVPSSCCRPLFQS